MRQLKMQGCVKVKQAEKREIITNIKNTTVILIGRMEEINKIHRELQKRNFLGIIGIGGIGKTSVALKYADEFKKN
jgi:ABC-type glutathione transport system ATPase component